MNIEEFKTYQKNFAYMQKLISEEKHELLLLPVIDSQSGQERVALCTHLNNENVFPHALLVWGNPHEFLKPLILDGIDIEGNDIARDEPSTNDQVG